MWNLGLSRETVADVWLNEADVCMCDGAAPCEVCDVCWLHGEAGAAAAPVSRRWIFFFMISMVILRLSNSVVLWDITATCWAIISSAESGTLAG